MYVHAIARDWRTANVSPIDAALCSYAEKLTTHPSETGKADVEALRAAGLDDRAIHDATQIISYFNYINRVADSLGVEPESFVRAWGEE